GAGDHLCTTACPYCPGLDACPARTALHRGGSCHGPAHLADPYPARPAQSRLPHPGPGNLCLRIGNAGGSKSLLPWRRSLHRHADLGHDAGVRARVHEQRSVADDLPGTGHRVLGSVAAVARRWPARLRRSTTGQGKLIMTGAMTTTPPVLAIENLTTSFKTPEGWKAVIRDVHLHVDAGETVAIVGESGSGKSVTALSTMRLLPAGRSRTQGRILLGGKD